MKQNIISAALIAVAVCVLGFFIYQSAAKFVDSKRVVSVRGLSEREVDANVVSWNLNYSLMGDDVQTLYGLLQQKNNILIDFLTINGIDRSEISISSPNISDRRANYYNNNDDSTLPRYTVGNSVTVVTSKCDVVKALSLREGELIKKGIWISSYANYEYTQLNDIKPIMVEEATKNARTVAEKFAQDSQCKVGKIQSATQGNFSISDVDGNVPQRKKVRVVTSVVYELK